MRRFILALIATLGTVGVVSIESYAASTTQVPTAVERKTPDVPRPPWYDVSGRLIPSKIPDRMPVHVPALSSSYEIGYVSGKLLLAIPSTDAARRAPLNVYASAKATDMKVIGWYYRGIGGVAVGVSHSSARAWLEDRGKAPVTVTRPTRQ